MTDNRKITTVSRCLDSHTQQKSAIIYVQVYWDQSDTNKINREALVIENVIVKFKVT